MKFNLILIPIFLLPFLLFGQDAEDKKEKENDIQWNKHKTEISLDFQFINKDLNLNSIGSNLIFRKHIGEKKFISKNDKSV